MVDQLRLIVAQLEKLTPAEQTAIAAQIEEILEEHEWIAGAEEAYAEHIAGTGTVSATLDEFFIAP
jgi:hypothetical protein